MQLLSHEAWPAMLAAQTMTPRYGEFLQREDVRGLLSILVILVIASFVLNVLANWLASRLLVDRDEATIGNALKLWLIYFVTMFVLAIVMGITLPVAAARGEPWRGWMVLGGGALLSLLLIFYIPMKIYVIGFGRAFLLLLLSAVFGAIAGFGLQTATAQFFGWESRIATVQKNIGETPAEQQRFFARLQGRNAPDEIDRLLDEALQPIGPRPSLAEREKAVAVLQQKLQERKRAIPPTLEAQATFKVQLDRYLRFLNEVKAERGTP